MAFFRRKPHTPDLTTARGRERQAEWETIAVSPKILYPDLMGAFHEDALDLADARTARDRSEDPSHG
ncbi:hypothetical protein [Frateuria sp. Soil773]|uniref:hypothetical protein n=1 Tax=Frateuria sp. Soil773 TaxID=1736407 RepID=UPI0012FB7732|nr:hypothetical protein [Frateuria sp. Soil773]